MGGTQGASGWVGLSGDSLCLVSSPELIIHWRGEVDVGEVDRLRAEIDRAFEQHPAGLVIDLSAVTFMDVRALGTLVGVRNRCLASDTALALRAVPDRIRRLLDIAGLLSLFTIEPVQR